MTHWLQIVIKTCNIALVKFCLSLIFIYKVCISPYMRQSCRFEVSCSTYAILCLKQHGFIHGMWKILQRLSRCHPFSSKCFDKQ